MRTLRFGRTNALVPAISLGTWGYSGPTTSQGVSVGWVGHDDDAAKAATFPRGTSGAMSQDSPIRP